MPWAQPRHAVVLASSLRQARAEGRKEEKEQAEPQQTREETRASSRANRLAVGRVPWLEGWPGLACPGRSQVGACSLRGSVLLEAGQLLEPCVGDEHRVLES